METMEAIYNPQIHSASSKLDPSIMPKSRDLLKAIQAGRFPIVLTGPSGVGKTHALLSATRTLGLSYRYVDISQTRISRPLQRHSVTHTVLYRLQDLENVRYTGNLVVETELHGVGERLPGSTEIKMTRPEFRARKKIRHPKYKEHSEDVDVFRFVGRVFYRKLRICEIERADGRIYYNKRATGSSQDTKASVTKVYHKLPTDNGKYKSDRNKASVTKVDHKPITDNGKYKSDRKFIIEESSASISFEEDRIFSSGEEERILSPAEEATPRTNSPTPLNRFPYEDFSTDCVSFPSAKIEAFLYANFPYFISLDSLTEVYECLSLTGTSEIFLESWIGAVLASRTGGKKGFFSFKVESPVNKLITGNIGLDGRQLNAWQYKFAE